MALGRRLHALTMLLCLALVGSIGAVSTTAEARAKKKPTTGVSWTSVSVRDGADQAQIEAWLKEILKEESKKARWGKKHEGPIDATITLSDLKVDESEDVVRVTCSAVGKVTGVGAAKSRFSYGGRPDEKLKLKRHVLELVARGIIGRLSEMVREKNGEAHEEVVPQKGSHKVASNGTRHSSTATKPATTGTTGTTSAKKEFTKPPAK